MGTAFSFDSTSFNDGTNYFCTGWSRSLPADVGITKVPRSDIGVAQRSGIGTVVHQVQIDVMADSEGTLKSKIRDLIAALTTDEAKKLYCYSDRYWWAWFQNWNLQETPHPLLVRVQATFVCADPFIYYDTTASAPVARNYNTPAGTISDTFNVIPGGTAYSFPVFTFNGPLKADMKLLNNTTGKWFQYEADLGAGDDLVVDTKARTIKLNDTPIFTDCTGDTTTGGFFNLLRGTNSMTFTAANGDNTGDISIAWVDSDYAL